MTEHTLSENQVNINSFDAILREMNEQGKFHGAVLASNDGLTLAAVPSPYDSDTAAAMVAMLQRVGFEARELLDMAEVDEISIFDQDRIRLVCRYVDLQGEKLILAVMVPPYQYYRRVTNAAIQRIQAHFNGG